MNPNNKDLLLEDGTFLKWLPKKHDLFLDKTTLIYGRTNSGKTTIIDEIMYLCKNYITVPFVITQSNVSKSAFDGKVPSHCIKTGINKEWIESFLNNQKGRAMVYNTANKMETLKLLFDKIKTATEELIENDINKKAASYIQKIENNPRLDYDKKRQETNAIKKIQAEHLTDLYKTIIRVNKSMIETKLKKNPDFLTVEEICSLNYLDFKPHVLLIFDDCASVFKKWVKESTVIKEMFYNGRHYKITCIITAQDDKEIDSELRKNAIVNIFTTHQAAQANFTRSSNSYPKHEKMRAETCIKRVFRQDSSHKNYKKLVYVQNDDDDPFYYIIADLYGEFKVGCPAVWALDKKLNDNRTTGISDELGSFISKYN